MRGRYMTTGAILLLAAATNGLPLADDAHPVMGGHYKTNLGKRAEQVIPPTQPGQGLSSPVLPPTATTPPPRATTQPGAPGTTGAGRQNPPVGAASNGATPTSPTQLPTGQGQPGILKAGSQGTASGPGSPSPTGVKPSEKKENTGGAGGVHEGHQHTHPQNNSKSQSRTSSSSSSKPKPKATGSTDLPGALPPSGGISANGVPTGAAPVPSPPGLEPLKPSASTALGGAGTSIVPGGVSSTVPSVSGNIRPTTTPLAGSSVSQGPQSPTAVSGQQSVVDPLSIPLSKTVSTPPGQVSPFANPAVQSPPFPGSIDPTLTQPLGATSNQPPAPQFVPALARRQQVNGLNPKTSTTSTSTPTKPQKTKTAEPKPKEEGDVPELRYELAGDYAGDKPETVGVSGSSSRISSSRTRIPTPPPVTNNGQPAPQQAGGAQFYNPQVWVPPQLLYESVGGMIDTPVFYPNVYPPPGPVVMVNENTRTTTGPTATSTKPPAPSRSGPTLVHESIDTQDPDAAVVKAAPPPHDPSPTPKGRGRDSTLGPSSTLRKVRRHGPTLGPSHTDLPLYENVGSIPEKPAAIGPADTYTPPSNTGTQSRNPGLLYESSGDGKDPVALPVIADVSHTTTSATTGSSNGPALKYEYGPGDNYPGAGIPAPILPTETGSTAAVLTSTQSTGGGPALKYEYAGAENERSSAHISTVTTTVYQPQPTPPPPALKYEYTGAENPAASPPTSTTTITHTLITPPAPTEGPPSHLPSQHRKRHEEGSPEEKGPLLTHEAAADPVPSDSPNPADIIESDGTHPRRKRSEVRERGFVGVDGVASAHSPADHGKRVRRSRQFQA